MTSWQKAIKYCAMAFAVFLTVSIIGGIAGGLGLISLFDDDTVLDEPKNFEVSADVKGINLEINAADLRIEASDSFGLTSNLKNLTVKEDNNRLIIREKSNGWFNMSGKGVVILNIPKDYEFNNAEISTGAGIVKIDGLTANDLSIELGAGKVDISNIIAKSNAKIDGGAGKLTMQNCSLNNFDLNMGVGEVNFSGRLTGNSIFDCGVGAMNAKILGTKEDYTISADKGLGPVTVDGKNMADDETLGTGNNHIKISGGVGAIKFDFE